MLMIQRKVGQEICIADDIVTRVEQGTGNQVKLGIKAPKSMKVWRVDDTKNGVGHSDLNTVE